jgi:hypothetical protein
VLDFPTEGEIYDRAVPVIKIVFLGVIRKLDEPVTPGIRGLSAIIPNPAGVAAAVFTDAGYLPG